MPSGREKLTYCIANVTAVLAALWIAFWFDLERPYWAMFTVFIVSKPISGAVRAKGIYRFAGTLMGASMSVFLVPPLVQSPVLLSLAVSLWVGVCLFASLQDRTPRSYMFLLAGYSVAIVAFSTVYAPTTIFDVAVTRLEEISIGIVCAGVAHSVFFPRNLADVLGEKADAAIRHSAQIVAKATARNPVTPSTSDIAILGSAVSDLHTLYTQVEFETSNVRRLPEVMADLLDRLATVLPSASLIGRSLTLLELKHEISTDIRAFLDETSATAARIARSEKPQAALPIAERDALGYVSIDAVPTGLGAVEQLVLLRTGELISALTECQLLAAELNDTHASYYTRHVVHAANRRPLYRDQGLALLSAVSAMAATLIGCVLWIETSWPEGFVAAQFAAIFASLFATLDKPSKVMSEAVVGIIVALPVAAIYEFAILPSIDGFPSLALVLTPMLLLFSFLQTFEKLEGAALVLAIAFSGALAIQESFVADFASFMNANLAEICGPLVAIATLLIFRTIDPVWNARRILASGRAALSDLAQPHRKDPKAWALQMIDRLGLAAARLSQAAIPATDQDIIQDVRIGMNVAALLEVRDTFGRTISIGIEHALALLGRLCTDAHQQSSARMRVNLRNDLAYLAESLIQAPPSAERSQGIAALTGLLLDIDPLRFDARGAS